jgi:hypothetical protein
MSIHQASNLASAARAGRILMFIWSIPFNL